MPRIVCNQPKCLFDICVDYAAVNIDDILKYEEQLELSKNGQHLMTFLRLPPVLYRLILDKILIVGSLHNGNYQRILNGKATDLILRSDTCIVTQKAEFLMFLEQQCKNIVRIDLEKLLWVVYYDDRVVSLVGRTLASMVHLEWINLRKCEINDERLLLIASKCCSLKYLNIEDNDDITDDGILGLRNCSELTHLYLRSVGNPPQFGVAAISEIIQRCSNLEILDYEHCGVALWNALSMCAKGHNTSISPLLPCSKAGTGLDSHLEPMVFKIKEIDFYSVPGDVGAFFRAVGGHCPSLENVTLPVDVSPGCLDGILHLPLRSVTIAHIGGFIPNMSNEVLMLLRSVGSSLTFLKLEQLTFFGLRVIKRECPNLQSLNLVSCVANDPDFLFPNYPVDELTNACFESLTNLTLNSFGIENEDLISLLASLQLEHLSLDILNLDCIEEVLQQYPAAFSNLKSAQFVDAGISRTTFWTEPLS